MALDYISATCYGVNNTFEMSVYSKECIRPVLLWNYSTSFIALEIDLLLSARVLQ
jgi:hypothetical protein